MVASNVGRRIKEAREAAKLKPSELAKRIGCTPLTVWRWEKEDGCLPNPKNLQLIASACGVSVDSLLGEALTVSA